MLAITLSSALFPVSALAQASGSLETGTLKPVRPAGGFSTSPGDVRSVVRQFGSCTIGRGRKSVEKYLAAPIGSAVYKRVGQRLFVDECVGAGELTMSDDVVRGALFEQLYLADFADAPLRDMAAVPRVDYRSGYEGRIPASATQAVARAEFGDCVARRATGKAHALLLTGPDTPGEAKAFGGLGPAFGPCIPSGQTIALSRSTVRGGIAEGLYRLSLAARAGALEEVP